MSATIVQFPGSPRTIDKQLLPAAPVENTPAGQQSVLPGAGRDAGGALARKLASEPLRGRKPQEPCDVGLFDVAARDQLPLI